MLFPKHRELTVRPLFREGQSNRCLKGPRLLVMKRDEADGKKVWRYNAILRCRAKPQAFSTAHPCAGTGGLKTLKRSAYRME